MAAILELNPIAAGDTTTAPAAAKTAPPAGTTVLDIVEKMITAEKPDVSQITGIYLKLRNAKKDLDEQAKNKTRPLTEGMDRIESFFLAKMLELGVDSLKNERGTPYKTQSVSVTVADVSVFMDYVLDRALQALPLKEQVRETIKTAMLDSGQLSLIEARASKSAVEAMLEETDELPPGLNRRVEDKVNVRTS